MTELVKDIPTFIRRARDRRRALVLALALALAAGAWGGGIARAAGGDGAGEFVTVGRLNTGLPAADDPPDLETPQSSLENFMLGGAHRDYLRAARSLNLNGVKPELQPTLGPELARQLREVIEQQLWFDWGDVPDRPDGYDDNPQAFGREGEGSKGPRVSLKLGSLFVGDLDVEIRLERVKPPDGPPVWAFSRQTVEHIPLLYEHYRSNRLESALPAVLKETRVGRVAVWQWIGFAFTLIAAGLLGWVVQRALNMALRWTSSAWARSVAEAIRGPGALTIGLSVSHYLVRKFLGLAGPVLSVLDPLYAAVSVFAMVWFLHRLVTVVTAGLTQRYESHGGDDANTLLTRIAVTRHLLTFLLIVLGSAYALSRFEWFREMGTTLLASAGVAGLILGVAAQRMLGNLFAGIVLALTQPVRAGDAILFEGQFGWIEEIAITYLVIRSWDLRRIVVPITYFLDHPFQNWSRRSQQLMMPVFMRADYRIDVEAVRNEFKAALEASPDWDKTVPPILQVTDWSDQTIELRALCSAANPASSWNLQCYVRERLLTFIRNMDGGRYLPRRRVAVVDEPSPSSRSNGKPAATDWPDSWPMPQPRPAQAGAKPEEVNVPYAPDDPCPTGSGVAGPPMASTPAHLAPGPET